MIMTLTLSGLNLKETAAEKKRQEHGTDTWTLVLLRDMDKICILFCRISPCLVEITLLLTNDPQDRLLTVE
jgi:hypothetical protein